MEATRTGTVASKAQDPVHKHLLAVNNCQDNADKSKPALAVNHSHTVNEVEEAKTAPDKSSAKCHVVLPTHSLSNGKPMGAPDWCDITTPQPQPQPHTAAADRIQDVQQQVAFEKPQEETGDQWQVIQRPQTGADKPNVTTEKPAPPTESPAPPTESPHPTMAPVENQAQKDAPDNNNKPANQNRAHGNSNGNAVMDKTNRVVNHDNVNDIAFIKQLATDVPNNNYTHEYNEAVANANRDKGGIFSIFGVDFAPVDIPMKRRLQTLAVVFYVSCFILQPFLFSLLSVVLLFTEWWWLPVGYMVWFFYDYYVVKTTSRGGRRSDWVRNGPHSRYFRDYFPITLEKTADLRPDRNYIVGKHPHGVMSCGMFGNYASNATGFDTKFPGIKPHMLTLSINLMWPLLRSYIMWVGSCEVNKESIIHLMTKQGVGNAAMIVIGGAHEAIFAKPNNFTLILKARKGFVKMALQTGASLVPTYSFGENDVFDQADNPEGSSVRLLQDKLRTLFGFTIPLFYGRGVFNYSFGMLPHRKPINTIFGRPIHLEKDEKPSQQKIDCYHEKYMSTLSELFDENKCRFGIPKDVNLQFI